MGPLLWWWRWWLGDDPNRDRQLTEARSLLDEQRTHADELAGQLQSRDREIEQLRTCERELAQARRELDELRARVAELEATTDGDTATAHAASAAGDSVTAQAATDDPPDVEHARAVLGSKVDVDDLTVVEGVGPKIAGLLTDAGIDSWRALADADVERLRLVLAEAGPRYRMHDPSSWPTQGRLLAEGRWQDFKDLVTA